MLTNEITNMIINISTFVIEPVEICIVLCSRNALSVTRLKYLNVQNVTRMPEIQYVRM